jgi:hypothetical protein
MLDWPEHPDDEYVEAAGFGTGPVYLRGRSAIADAVAQARAAYVTGAITHDEFEVRIDAAIAGATLR